MMIDIAAIERRADLAAKDPVFVGLRFGLETRMEIEWSFFHSRDADVRRQQTIRGSAQILQRNRVLYAQRGHLRDGMNPGVRAARSGHLYCATFDLTEDLLQRSLDSRQTWLHLPAVIVRAVVGDLDLNSSHGRAGNPASPPDYLRGTKDSRREDN